MPAAHDIYAEQLGELRRGHALYYPEPRPEGPVEIGDVGYTKHGAFFRLFNASRPADDPVQRFGVPNDFVPLDMGVIDTFEAALEPGPLHSKAISTLSAEVGTPGDILPAEASFRFSCSSKRGAILMLETQMIHQEAVQHHRLENYLIQHCHSWHAFARSLDIRIGFGELMLVTECSKTAAWSSAVYSNSSTEFGLSFSVGMPFSTAGIAASSSLDKIGPLERRRSQQRALVQGSPLPMNHTVFIKAYRLGMRQMYYQSLISLFMKARGPGVHGNRGEKGTMNEVTPQITSPTSQEFTPSAVSSDSFIMHPREPDFHPSITLLGLAMETDDGSECVVLHDSVWCSADPDSRETAIMKEYADFYFSNEVDNYLNTMSGEEVFNPAVLQQDVETTPYFEGNHFNEHVTTLEDQERHIDSQSNTDRTESREAGFTDFEQATMDIETPNSESGHPNQSLDNRDIGRSATQNENFSEILIALSDADNLSDHGHWGIETSFEEMMWGGTEMEDLFLKEDVSMEDEALDGFLAWPSQNAHHIHYETTPELIPWDTFSVTDSDVDPLFYDPSSPPYDGSASQLFPTETYYGPMETDATMGVKGSHKFSNDFIDTWVNDPVSFLPTFHSPPISISPSSSRSSTRYSPVDNATTRRRKRSLPIENVHNTVRNTDTPQRSTLRPPPLAPSAWQLYFTDWIQKQQASSTKKLNVAQAAKEAGKEYAALSLEEKEPYKQRSSAAKEARDRDFDLYMRSLTPDEIWRENAFRAAQRKASKSRKANIRDPNAPKKPLNAYFGFWQTIRANPQLAHDIFGDVTETTKQSVLAASRWRSMTDEERQPFLAQAEKEKIEYEAAKKLYEEGLPPPHRTSSINSHSPSQIATGSSSGS